MTTSVTLAAATVGRMLLLRVGVCVCVCVSDSSSNRFSFYLLLLRLSPFFSFSICLCLAQPMLFFLLSSLCSSPVMVSLSRISVHLPQLFLTALSFLFPLIFLLFSCMFSNLLSSFLVLPSLLILFIHLYSHLKFCNCHPPLHCFLLSLFFSIHPLIYSSFVSPLPLISFFSSPFVVFLHALFNYLLNSIISCFSSFFLFTSFCDPSLPLTHSISSS